MVRFLLIMTLLVSAAFGQDTYPITARHVALFDARSGKMLYSKNPQDQTPVASTQKLLTALIIAKAGNLDKKITIAPSDTKAEPTKLYFKAGETYTRRALLTALLVKSANDAAVALARDNAGSVAAFAQKMNSTMRQLGGRSSNFVNPNGLPNPNQYSSARDMAIVAGAAYRNKTLRQIMGIKNYSFRMATGKTKNLKNTNRLLHNYSFCNGMKTGYTNAAGKCLISSGQYKGREIISVVLGCATGNRVWDESLVLLAYGLGIPQNSIESFRIGHSTVE